MPGMLVSEVGCSNYLLEVAARSLLLEAELRWPVEEDESFAGKAGEEM